MSASFIQRPGHPPQPHIPPNQPQQVSQQGVAQQNGLQNEQAHKGEMKVRQLLPPPSWAPFGSGSSTPTCRLSATPGQQYSRSSSHLKQGTSVLTLHSMTSTSDQEGTAPTKNSKGGRTGRGPNMNRHQKLTLAKLCSTHSAEYRFGSRGKFWLKMRDLLKQETGYDHKGLQSVVERWMKIRQTETFVREMESGKTQEESKTFTEAVDKFAERWQHSHKHVAGEAADNKTAKEESNNAREACHNSVIDNATDVGIIKVRGDCTPQEKEEEGEEEGEEEEKEEDTTPVPNGRRVRRLAAEDSMAESFSRIADYLVGESQEGRRSDEQGGSLWDRPRKRPRSHSNEDEQLARIEAKIDAKMDEFMARICKKLDDFAAKNAHQL